MNSAESTSPRYGIRVSLPTEDPFAHLVGEDWVKTHWFSSLRERDRVLKDMAREHEYSRRGDKPALIYEAINRSAESSPA